MRIVAKRRMAVWCAVLAAVFFAAGLFAFCYPLKARAAEVTPASIITANEATVNAGKLNKGAVADDGYDVTGLTVEGGAGYSASLKGVFKEDVKLDFALLSKIATDTTPANFGGQGAFSFRVTDAGDPTSYFDIILQPVYFWGTWHNVAYVRYGNEIRWRQHGKNGGTGIFDTDIVADASNSLYAWAAIPMNGADGITENSYIKLSWSEDDKDILNVSVMCGHNYNTAGERYEIVIASFDGTSALNSANKEFGLEKLTGMKENGFTISFGSDYTDGTNSENNGTDICLTKLTVGELKGDGADNGTVYDLTSSEPFDSAPQWYTDYQSRATITLAEEPAPYWNRDLGAYTVPEATYTTVGNSDPQKVVSVKLTKDGTEVSISGNQATFEENGEYTLTYTAVEGSDAIGNTVSYTINVGNYFLANELIDGEGIDVASGKLNTGATEDEYDVTGLTVEGGAGYSASLKGVFKEDVKLDFALLSKVAAEGGNGFGGKGRLTFRIADAGDPDTYFEIVIRSEDWFGSSRNFAYVRYGEEIRWRVHGPNGGGNICDVDVLQNTEMAQYAYAAIPFDGADANTENSYIRLSWSGDVLNVSVMCGHNYNNPAERYEIIIASFDGTTELNNETKAYGLEKLTGMKENGFTISFGSDYTDGTNAENDGTDICLTKLTVARTDYDLTTNKPFDSVPQWYSDYQSLTTITLAEQPVLSWSTELGEYTVPSATYTTVSGGETKPVASITLTKDGGTEVTIDDGKAVFSENGTYTLTYTAVKNSTAVGNTVSYTIEVGDHFLADELIDGEEVVVTRGKTNAGATEDEYDVTGLTVEGGAGYSASLKGVFNESVKLDFALLSKDIASGNTNGKGHFTFTVASASNPNDYFEIQIVPASYNRTTIYVRYGNDYRMATDQNKYFYGTSVNDLPDIAGIGNNDAYTWVKTYLAGADLDNEDSYIRLQKDGDVLSVVAVSAVSAQSHNEYTIAKFDGETQPNANTDLIGGKTTYNNCCLPKLAWNDGFTISFGSDYKDEANPENDGTDICFKKITVGSTAYDLSTLAIDTEAPDWVGVYDKIVEWDVADGEETIPNREYTVRNAAYSLKDGVTTGEIPFKTEYAYLGESGEGEPSWTPIADGKFTPVEAGVYEIRYTAVNDDNLNNTYSYRVTVREVQKIAHPTLTGASSVFYDGDRQYAPVAESDDYVISGRLFATKAGKYTTVVSLKDKVFTEWEDGSTDDLIYVWSIVKVTPVITADTEQSAEYDGEAQTVTASIKGVEGEEITYKVSWYADAEHEHKMESAPVAAGTYYASVWYSGSENFYAAKVVYVTFTVTKVKVTAPNAPAEVIYNGQEQTAEIAQNAAYTVAGNKQTNAGTYEIAVTLNDAENYEWSNGTSETLTLSWTIAKATPVITAEAVQSAEYDGKTQDVTASIVGVNGEELTVTVTWYSDAQLKNELEGAPVEAGTYYAVLSYAESDNYTAAESVSVTFTVTEDADEPVGPVDPDDPDDPDDPVDPDEPSETEEPKGLSGGAIAAIVISCVVVVGAAAIVGVAIYKKKAAGTSKK